MATIDSELTTLESAVSALESHVKTANLKHAPTLAAIREIYAGLYTLANPTSEP